MNRNPYSSRPAWSKSAVPLYRSESLITRKSKHVQISGDDAFDILNLEDAYDAVLGSLLTHLEISTPFYAENKLLFTNVQNGDIRYLLLFTTMLDKYERSHEKLGNDANNEHRAACSGNDFTEHRHFFLETNQFFATNKTEILYDLSFLIHSGSLSRQYFDSESLIHVFRYRASNALSLERECLYLNCEEFEETCSNAGKFESPC